MTMFAAALPPKGGWKVTGQIQQTRLAPGTNTPAQGYTINFVTGYGTNGSVFVPQVDYTAANVQSAVAAQVAQLDAVDQLTHETS